MAIDLKNMSRKELEALRARVDKQLEKLKKSDMKKAIEAAEAAARQHGYSLTELSGAAPAKKTRAKKAAAPSSAKYRNPDNAAATWTGRGRRPEWIKAGLAAGKTLEDFAIR